MLFRNASHGRLLVVAPHADDEVIGAGGLILAAVEAGWSATVLYMTAAGFASQATGKASSDSERRAEARAAGAVLGVSETAFFEEGTGRHLRLDTLPQADLIGWLEAAIAGAGATVVAMPSGQHFHQDHRAVARACEAALRPAPASARRPAVPIVLAYSYAGGDWARAGRPFRPTLFVTLDARIEKKLEALACYRSQVADPPHARSLDALRAWHRHWGVYAGVDYAEPFEVVRYVS